MKCVFVDGNIISAVSLCNLVFLEEMFEYKQCIYSGRNPYRSRLGKKKLSFARTFHHHKSSISLGAIS
jgi:hypothetical protein